MVNLSENGAEGKIYPLKILCKIKLKKKNENPELRPEGGHYVKLDIYLNTWI